MSAISEKPTMSAKFDIAAQEWLNGYIRSNNLHKDIRRLKDNIKASKPKPEPPAAPRVSNTFLQKKIRKKNQKEEEKGVKKQTLIQRKINEKKAKLEEEGSSESEDESKTDEDEKKIVEKKVPRKGLIERSMPMLMVAVGVVGLAVVARIRGLLE